MFLLRASQLATSTNRKRRFTLLGAATKLSLGLGLVIWAGSPAIAADESAQAIATTVCAACHAADGNSAVPMFPKLAGQHAEYTEKQLKEFISGKRKNDVMIPVIANLKPEDLTALAVYFAAQKPAPGVVQDAALASAGKKIFVDGNEESGVPACAGCHQPMGEGDARFPRLAGQHQGYLFLQMKNFASGERANDLGRVMRAVAKRLTEQEMKSVSEYIAGL